MCVHQGHQSWHDFADDWVRALVCDRCGNVMQLAPALPLARVIPLPVPRLARAS